MNNLGSDSNSRNNKVKICKKGINRGTINHVTHLYPATECIILYICSYHFSPSHPYIIYGILSYSMIYTSTCTCFPMIVLVHTLRLPFSPEPPYIIYGVLQYSMIYTRTCTSFRMIVYNSTSTSFPIIVQVHIHYCTSTCTGTLIGKLVVSNFPLPQ